MTTLTLRYHKGYFVVSPPPPNRPGSGTRREAKDWCHTRHPWAIQAGG